MIADLKPYPEYKESGLPWLGQVPKHWEVRPAFGAFSSIHERNDGMKEKTVLSLSYGRIIVKPLEKLHGLVPESFETYQIVKPGDIILRTTDLQNDHTSLRVGMVRNRGIITSAYLALRTGPGVNPEFGFQFLNVWDSSKAIYGYGSGLRQNLDFSHFKRMPVTVPPPEEQEAIVRFLDWATGRLDRAIRAKRKIIALLNEKKQVIIQRAVTRGLDPNVPLKDSGIPWLGEIPKKWRTCSLKRVVQVKDGTHDTPLYCQPGANTYPLVTSRHIVCGRIQVDRANHIGKKDYEAIIRRSDVALGDVIMPMIGTIGNPVIVKIATPFAIKNIALFKTSLSSAMTPAFLIYIIESPSIQWQFDDLSRGGVQDFVSLGVLRNLQIPKINTEEQAQIVRYLDKELKVNNMAITLHEREIELLREYRTRLIADVVTGKLDVREAATQLPVEAIAEVVDDIDEEESDVADEEVEP